MTVQSVPGVPVTVAIPTTARLPFPLRSVARRWRKIIGPTIGVGVALAIVFALLAIASGGSKLTYGEYELSGADVYFISRGGVFFPLIPGDSPGTIDNGRSILRLTRSFPGVRGVVGITSGGVQRDLGRDETGKKRTEPLQAIGVWGDPSSISSMLNLQSGRWLTRDNEIVIGSRLANLKNMQVGDRLILSDRVFQVVGVATLRGAGFAGLSSIYVDYDALLSLNDGKDQISVGIVDSTTPDDTAQRIREARRLDVYTRSEVIEQGKNLSSADQVIYNIFSILGLVIAGLFVGNVLTMSVSERRIEFATMRAIGLSRRTILSLIMAEAFAIALVAYVAGCGLGYLLTVGIDQAYQPLLGLSLFSGFDSSIFVRILLVDLVLAMIAGFLPARAALRVQPVEVLREA